jgi:hypothetical protein
MNQCNAVFLNNTLPVDRLATGDVFNDLKRYAIDHLLWSDTGYKPGVFFQIAHTSSSIILKYVVREHYIEPIYRKINDPVYKDSCVELFIAFNDDASYYNLEFNAAGIPLAGYGSSRLDRVSISSDVLKHIESFTTIGTTAVQEDGMTGWELVLVIPFHIFVHHHIDHLKGQVCRANFYKCGDDLPRPHFLSWSAIHHPSPDFHLPEFFGRIHFT